MNFNTNLSPFIWLIKILSSALTSSSNNKLFFPIYSVSPFYNKYDFNINQIQNISENFNEVPIKMFEVGKICISNITKQQNWLIEGRKQN